MNDNLLQPVAMSKDINYNKYVFILLNLLCF